MMAGSAWSSPITPQAVASASVRISDPKAANGRLYWLESRPAEGGRSTLMVSLDGDKPQELTPAPWNPRSRVHEYGGGAWTPMPDGVCLVDHAEQNLHHFSLSGEIRQITRSDADTRYADLCHDPQRGRLLAVTELHGGGRAEPENALAAIDLASGTVNMLHRGHDFYAAPRLSPDGRELLFVAWDHPNMPWDGSLLLRARLDGQRLGEIAVIAGGAAESVLQPAWTPDGEILYLSDAGGFWNLHILETGKDKGRPLRAESAEYGAPAWAFDQRTHACLDQRRIAACRQQNGWHDLLLIDRQSGASECLLSGCAGLGSLSADQGRLYLARAHTDAHPELICLAPDTHRQTSRRRTPVQFDASLFSRPDHITFPTRDGGKAHAWRHCPRSPDERQTADKPPLLVTCHGGPTGAASASLNLLYQFYTSRGWQILDVDYRGSSGYGRAYREALAGHWGLIDVSDCEDAVACLLQRDKVDPNRVAIRGGSAGGYTVLRALTTSQVFRAGASHYGIGDLTALAEDTHKFESRYIDRLVGGSAPLAETLVARSPIHHLEGLNCPVIFFQGGADRIVPPNQAEAMVAGLRRKGLPVAHLLFPEEGHGFRDGNNIARCIAAEYSFFCRVFNLPEPTDLPPLEIENL